VTSSEAIVKINAGHYDIIVDIRSSFEYEQHHVEGAINMPMHTAIEKLKGCEDKKIAVHCFHGYDRARPFSHKMANGGYSNVYDIGGFKNLRDHVQTSKGAWDGVLPACSKSHTRRTMYIKSEVSLTGITSMDAAAQVAFKEVIADNCGNVCGTAGDTKCDKSDLSITSINSGRRSSHVNVNFAIKATSTSAAAGVSNLTDFVRSPAFVPALKAKSSAAPTFNQVTAASLVRPPNTSTKEDPIPANQAPANTPSSPSPPSKNQFGVMMVPFQ
jgi:rhodanese-related sulfurtransferase